jgi:ABC-type nickel/cobalt efflux system permease component RcnA
VVNVLSATLVGFLLGMRHATDPDHVVAVATIVSQQRSIGSAMLIGSLWGLGHTITILLCGGAIILFNVVIPPWLGLSMEFAVALMLIALGLITLTGRLQRLSDTLGRLPAGVRAAHSHPQRHGEHVHVHPHSHADDAHQHAAHDHLIGALATEMGRLGSFHVLRPVVVGIVHGLAGSAAVALLVLASIPNPAWQVAYLVVFGIGTVAGMSLITAANALPFAMTAVRFTALNRYLNVASGVLSLAFGLFLAYQIGFVDGLFLGDPRWAPR